MSGKWTGELDIAMATSDQGAMPCVGYFASWKQLPTVECRDRLANPNLVQRCWHFRVFFFSPNHTLLVLHRSIDRDPKSAG